MRGRCDPDGVSDGSRLAIYQSLSNECPSCVARVRISTMHPFYVVGSPPVSASYLSFLAFYFCLRFFPFIF